jgi:hypothetical protein
VEVKQSDRLFHNCATRAKGGCIARPIRSGFGMSEEDPDPTDRSKAYVASLGIGALLAWFALLWFMFGDVL